MSPPWGVETACGSAAQRVHPSAGLTVSYPQTPTRPSKPTHRSASSQRRVSSLPPRSESSGFFPDCESPVGGSLACHEGMSPKARNGGTCDVSSPHDAHRPALRSPGGHGTAAPTFSEHLPRVGASSPTGPFLHPVPGPLRNAPRRHREPSVCRTQLVHPAFRTPWSVSTLSGCLPVGAGAQCAQRSGEHTRELVTVPPGRLWAASAPAYRSLCLLPGPCAVQRLWGPARPAPARLQDPRPRSTPRPRRTPAPGLPHSPTPPLPHSPGPPLQLPPRPRARLPIRPHCPATSGAPRTRTHSAASARSVLEHQMQKGW